MDNMNGTPRLREENSQRKKKEKSVLDFTLDEGNYTPFINRQPAKVLRKCFTAHRHCQGFDRGKYTVYLHYCQDNHNQEL